MNGHINFTPFAVLWMLLLLIVLAMIAYRRIISAKDDESLHLSAGPAVERQILIAHKLDVIDKWGKLLTIVAVLYGLLLGIAYTWVTWLSSNTSVGM